jgi:hypothetical protein
MCHQNPVYAHEDLEKNPQYNKVIHKVTMSFTPYPLFQWYPQSKEIWRMKKLQRPKFLLKSLCNLHVVCMQHVTTWVLFFYHTWC